MDERIINFLKAQTNLTLATSNGDQPYCANCFYACTEDGTGLIFKSKQETEHAQQVLKNPNVAGSILPDKLVLARLQGIQFTGAAHQLTGEELKNAEQLYNKKFSMARAVSGEFWMITLQNIKMTDNIFGIGNKLKWTKEVEVSK